MVQYTGYFFVVAEHPPSGHIPPHFLSFNITMSHTTLCRFALDERSVRRRDLYLKTHNTHNRQISIPPVGFEPTVLAGELPQTNALDRAVTGTRVYSGANKSLARPGRKQAKATEGFDVHISYL